jgi:hypothetical protein
VYSIANGHVTDLNVTVSDPEAAAQLA